MEPTSTAFFALSRKPNEFQELEQALMRDFAERCLYLLAFSPSEHHHGPFEPGTTSRASYPAIGLE